MVLSELLLMLPFSFFWFEPQNTSDTLVSYNFLANSCKIDDMSSPSSHNPIFYVPLQNKYLRPISLLSMPLFSHSRGRSQVQMMRVWFCLDHKRFNQFKECQEFNFKLNASWDFIIYVARGNWSILQISCSVKWLKNNFCINKLYYVLHQLIKKTMVYIKLEKY